MNVYNFVNSNLRYPRDASKEGIEGRVYVQFIVKEDGYLDSIRILKGQLPSMNKEALRLAKLLPQPWKPGKNLQGQPAKSWYMLPVTFHLE
ncbi:MAG: energy transducer TonB [Sphingobacteriales bacterium]|nr:MAG: energy transducer TonB [Sphingobacteriales bacterium]